MKRLLTLCATLFLFIGSVALQADEFDPVLPPEPQTKYPVTVGTADPAGASVSGAGWYTQGSQVQIACYLKENYTFRYWTLNGDSCSDQQYYYYTVSNGQANFMAYVQYVEPVVPPITPDTVVPEPPFDPSLPDEPTGGKQEFTSRVLLATIPAEAGYFSHASGSEFKEDSTVTFCAYANENYILEGWYQDDSLISQQECVDITIPIKDVSLVAKYRLVDNPVYRSNLYLATNLAGACMFNIISGNQYVEGSKVIISRTTTSIHEWLGWYIGETLISTDSAFVYTTGRNDVTIWAMYREVFNPSLPGDPTGGTQTEIDNRPTVMIEAPFKEGWVFDHWSDGVTNNPRSVLVENQYDYTPIYVPGNYIVQLQQDICEGDAYNFQGQSLTEEGIYRDTLTAANTGDSILVLSLFVHPTYTIIENVQITVGDSFLLGKTYYYTSGTYQQTFVSQYGCDSVRVVNLSVVDSTQFYSITVHSADSAMGRVTGSGTYPAQSLVKISATGFTGYAFSHWNDMSIDNPRYVLLTSDTEYTAYFTTSTGQDTASHVCTITLSSNNIEWGTVSGSGSFLKDATISVQAIPAAHCHFVQWSDGSTSAVRSFTITSDMTLEAIFALDTHALQLICNNQEGTVIGAGTYDYNSQVNIEAIPNTGYSFVQWSDGNTSATRSITITEDMTLQAVFAVNRYTVTLSCNNQEGSVTGAGTYDYNSQVNIEAIPNTDYSFVQWSDGDTSNPRMIVVTADVTLEAIFVHDSITITTIVDTIQGMVIGGGRYAYLSNVVLEVIPKEGYAFVQWTDGEIANPRSVVASEDATYEALLEPIQNGWEAVNGNKNSDISKILINSHLYILRDGGIYNANGQKIR